MSRSPESRNGERTPYKYKIDTSPIPLDTLAVYGEQECWYRIPSWRVHFDHDALRDEDIRMHRSIGSHSAWTLTEATTGLKLHSDLPTDFYVGDEGAMLAEFAAGRMLQLTKENMKSAIAKGKEKLSKHSLNPFVPSETPAKPDPVADLCAHIKESIRLCGHGYIHMTCGDCQRRD
jgi:hypothetical protein